MYVCKNKKTHRNLASERRRHQHGHHHTSHRQHHRRPPASSRCARFLTGRQVVELPAFATGLNLTGLPNATGGPLAAGVAGLAAAPLRPLAAGVRHRFKLAVRNLNSFGYSGQADLLNIIPANRPPPRPVAPGPPDRGARRWVPE